MKRLTSTLTPLLFVGIGMLAPKAAWAFGLEMPGCVKAGKCQLCDLLQLVINISELFLGILGALSLAFFIYGGIWLMISGGNEQRIATGKKIIGGSITGVVIVFAAYITVNFIMWALIEDENSTIDSPQVFSSAWFDGASCQFSTAPGDCTGKATGDTCGHNQICSDPNANGERECITRCDAWVETKKDTQPEIANFGCKTITTCQAYSDGDMGTYDECTTENNCVKDMCPGSDTSDTGALVCCE